MALYDVDVKTPLGKFSGNIEIIIDGEALSGSFSIISFKSDFKGTAKGEELSLSGSLMTPVGELIYDASGTLAEDGFRGIAHTRIGDFEFAPPRHKSAKKRAKC